MGFFDSIKSFIGPVLGGGLGALLAPFTGGASLPLMMGLGAAGGSGIQSAVEGRNFGEALPGMALSGLGGYGAGSLMPGVGTPGGAGGTMSSGTLAGQAGLSQSGLHSVLNSATAPGIGTSGLAAGGGTGVTGGGFGAMAKKYAPYVAGAGALDYMAKGAGIESQQEASQQALNQYLASHKESTEWSDSDRQNMMKAVMGIYSEDMEAAKRKTSSSMASRGVGGGSYGKKVKDIERQGREAAARSLAGTFKPSGQPPSASAFFSNAAAQGRNAGAETGQDMLNFGGQMSTLALINQLFK